MSANAGESSGQTFSLLFTAFEPSGDALAARVIEALTALVPDLKIYAWGGPKMQEAGATLVEQTVTDAAMGLGALSRVQEVRRQVGNIRRWAKSYRVLAHVAVDSPAANFPICKVTRKAGARVVNLVAPQLWAWGGWRVKKVRRLTDLILCLLPFEEQWFKERDIPARFIGHPALQHAADPADYADLMHGLPQGSPRLAILPGSRTQEVKANLGLLSKAFTELHDRYSGLSGTIVAARPELADLIRRRMPVFPTGLHMMTGELDTVLSWADLCLAVSGTVSLDITRHATPMIGVYKVSPIAWLVSKGLLRTPYRLLPNIIANQEVIPEFVPHAGGAMPIVAAASRILQDSKHSAVQAEAMRRILAMYANKRPAEEAARLIIKIARGESM